MDTVPALSPKVDDLAARLTTSFRRRTPLLHELLDLYEQAADVDPEAAGRARQAFLRAIERWPGLLKEQRFAHFLAEHVQPDDFAALQWRAPRHVAGFYESLYRLQYDGEAQAERVRDHLGHLVRHALRQFEQQGDMEQIFRLLQVTPPSPEMLNDPELLRLRGLAHLYEARLVQWKRRLLYAYLFLQALLVVVVFPLLFIYAENGYIEAQIEKATDIKLPNQGLQHLTYLDGLYWSMITAASIGYGDITPRTAVGRFIAAVLGTIGVITVGVLAGLILSWLTPRRLD